MISLKKLKGFTLIELVIVLVILGILVAIIIPRYVDLQSDAIDAAKKATANSVKSAFAIAIASTKNYPTVTSLKDDFLTGTNSVAAPDGIDVLISGTTYTVPTYTDEGCNSATGAVGDTVKCVGDI